MKTNLNKNIVNMKNNPECKNPFFLLQQNNISYKQKATEKAFYFYTNLLQHKEEILKVAIMFP